MRRVVITGGSSGLGLALAKALTQRGDSVALVARDEYKLAEAIRQVRAVAPTARVLIRAIDVTKGDATDAGFAELARELGGIDLLVNSAGILREGYFERLTDADHRTVMDVNYFGTLNAIRAALPFLKKSTQARVLNVASVAALTGVFGYTAYCASKHALLGASEALRYELAPQGIRVQIACPSEFDSPMVDALDRTRTPENRAHTLTIPKVSVEAIVRDILRGLDGSDFMIVPGLRTRVVAFSIRHFPAIGRLIGDRRINKVYTGPRQNRG